MGKVFLGTPIYRDAPVEFMLNVRSAFDKKIVHTVGMKLGDSLVSRARNNLTHEFLKTDCDYLLQIDSDIVFNQEQIKRIISHELPIVGGIYPIKEKETRWCLNKFKYNFKSDSELKAVSETGTGFLLIRRDVFEAIRDDNPVREYVCDMDGEIKYDYWRVGVKNRRYLSEDWWFCQDAREAGFDILVDTKIILGHIGNVVYPLEETEFKI
jgi:hypothetical protein